MSTTQTPERTGTPFDRALAGFQQPSDRERASSGTPPARSPEQRQRALDRANEVRKERARIKRDLRVEREPLMHDLIDHPPDVVRSARVEDMLIALPRWGRKKVGRTLTRNDISATKTLQGLTPRQRAALHRALGGGTRR